MLDQKIPARPRVALVFGDADSVRHLREAVSSQVEIVYETSAADFDASRVVRSQATAALVNLDDCESLDSVEARLQETGVAVVFNDPEISSQLEGWAQARWLRHLTAKLSGSSDFDPPRPTLAQAAPAIAGAAPIAKDLPESETPVADEALVIVERPLSPAEIESMTADFGAMQELLGSSAGSSATMAPVSSVADGSTESLSAIVEPATETLRAETAPDALDLVAMPEPHSEHGGTDALDVDTEALSAMIDARLAAAAGEPEPESPEVWREIDGGTVAAIELPPVPEPADAEPVVASAAPVDDTDVLKALPSLDDWQLVDPDAPLAPAPSQKRDERALPSMSIDIAGLELMPVETVVPVALSSESVERWMHNVDGDKGRAAANNAQAPTAKSGGERA